MGKGIWKKLSFPNALFKKQDGKFSELFIVHKVILTGKPNFGEFDIDSF